MEWLNKKRVIFQNLTNRRELLERNLEDMRKKIDNNNFRLERLYKKIADLQDLIQHGKGMENSFFCKQDFLSFKIEYEENSSLKNKLLKWLEQYQVNICSELNETELDKEIQLKLKEIENFQKEVTELSRHIEIQKRQNDNIDTITQEIFNLVEQYNKFHPFYTDEDFFILIQLHLSILFFSIFFSTVALNYLTYNSIQYSIKPPGLNSRKIKKKPVRFLQPTPYHQPFSSFNTSSENFH